MEKNYISKNMIEKSDTELKDIISENSKYTKEAIKAATWEIENRNLKQSENLDSINEQTESEFKPIQIENVERENNKVEFFKKDPNVSDDPNLSKFYTKKAIYGFSVFFTTIFGAVLLMSNLKKNENTKARFIVLTFGILYTIFSIYLLNILNSSTLLTLIFNGIGSIILTEYFWNKYIGKDFKHRRKGIFKPLIISILIIIPFVLLIFIE